MAILVIKDTPEGNLMANALVANGLAEKVESDCSLLLEAVDCRMKRALDTMKHEGLMEHGYDYIWVMQFLNEMSKVKTDLFFSSVQSYQNYLVKYLRVDGVAGVSTLSQYKGFIEGKWPQWTFRDTDARDEYLRRKQIVLRFSALFYKTLLSENLSEIS